MACRPFKLARLSPAERHAITLLRGGPCDHQVERAFALLRGEVATAGYSVQPLESAYVGPHELRLLGWLVLLQRQRPNHPANIDPRLRANLARCARFLDAAGIWLPYGGALRAEVHDRGADAYSDPQTPRARACEFVRQRGCVRAFELKVIGMSREYIKSLCKQGMLRRAGFGIYALADERQPSETVPRQMVKRPGRSLRS